MERNPSSLPAEPNGSLPFQPRRVLRPREQVEEQLQRAILSRHLKHGDRLPSESELATTFSVSRTTVREALRSLTAKGLIRKSPGSRGGSFVQSIDHHTLEAGVREQLRSVLQVGSVSYDEIAELRCLLEIPSARLAAVHRTGRQLEDLRNVIEGEKGERAESPNVLEMNMRFHEVVALASQNRILWAFTIALHRSARPLTFIDRNEELGRQAVRHHIRIYKAIAQQDPDAAGEAMKDHLTYLQEHVDHDTDDDAYFPGTSDRVGA